MPLAPITAENSQSAATALLAQLRTWEASSSRPGIPADLDPIDLEHWQEPIDSLPGDFHLLDQPQSFQLREFHARPIRHHHSST